MTETVPYRYKWDQHQIVDFLFIHFKNTKLKLKYKISYLKLQNIFRPKRISKQNLDKNLKKTKSP